MNITSANYNNQPKFKALKIDAETVTPLLEQAKPEYIKRLDNVGKDLVGIKRFNVVLKDTLTPKVFAQDPVKYGHRDYFKELKYDIEIIKASYQKSAKEKSIVFRVKDPRLLEMTGGIVQGMSGSPIMQDGKIVGAVTHVFLNDPTKGYGVYVDWMVGE